LTKSFAKQQQQQSPQQNRSSGLHTVNEEDYQKKNNMQFQQREDSPLIQRKQRSSVAHFNSFPTKRLDDFEDNSRLSRADVLAETEAKLNGHNNKASNRFNGHAFEDGFAKQNRRLSEPNTRIYQSSSYSQQQPSDPYYERHLINSANKRMSFQYGSSSSPRDETRRLSLSSSSKLHLDADSRSSVRDWRSKSPNGRPHSTVGLMNHRLSTGSSIFEGGSNNGHQRKPLFTSHLPFSSVVPHLKSNMLVSGLLRVNKRNRSDAYVFCEEYNADIYICGSRDRNRALEGDHVAIKLIEVDQVMQEKHEKEEAKLARNNGNPVVRKPDEEDEKEIIFGGEEDVDLVKPRFCGVVVAILDRAQKQVFSGTLGLTRPSNKRPRAGDDSQQRESSVPRIIWFKPTDKRVPLIAIPVEQAPSGFIENSEAFENRLFLVSFIIHSLLLFIYLFY
jgi:exoribonuclease R